MVFLQKLTSTNFSDGFHLKKRPLNKRNRFPLVIKSVSTSLNEGFRWKRRKINYHWQESLKYVEKNDFHQPENQLSTSKKSSFSQNCFLLIPIMVSTSSEIALTKKYSFHWAENLFALAGWRLLKNMFPLHGKAASALKNWKNWYPLAEIWFAFKKLTSP